ncbi:MAG: four-carbon acid sugar kinase family protein, partial [Nitrososphaeria archaeon]
MTPLFGVIADDFTGACDVGVQFRKRGLETVVLAGAQSLTGFEGELDVAVLNTESRNAGPEDAYGKVRDSLGALRKIGARLVYKKIDSTLRGNLGAELDAIMDEAEVKAVIVAPSFPAQKRTTVDGHLLVNNTPLGRTEFALEPSNRLEASHI